MKNVASLIYTTYFRSYLQAEALVDSLTGAPALSPEQLQQIGYHAVLANELRPLLDTISSVQYFVGQFDEPMDSAKYLIRQVQELQTCIRKNQKVITPGLPERMEVAIRNAKDQVHAPVPKNIRVPLFDLEPDEPYEYSGDMINVCFKNAPKADPQQIPVLLTHIQALNQLDTTLPFKELRRQSKSIVKQLKTL